MILDAFEVEKSPREPKKRADDKRIRTERGFCYFMAAEYIYKKLACNVWSYYKSRFSQFKMKQPIAREIYCFILRLCFRDLNNHVLLEWRESLLEVNHRNASVKSDPRAEE